MPLSHSPAHFLTYHPLRIGKTSITIVIFLHAPPYYLNLGFLLWERLQLYTADIYPPVHIRYRFFLHFNILTSSSPTYPPYSGRLTGSLLSWTYIRLTKEYVQFTVTRLFFLSLRSLWMYRWKKKKNITTFQSPVHGQRMQQHAIPKSYAPSSPSYNN